MLWSDRAVINACSRRRLNAAVLRVAAMTALLSVTVLEVSVTEAVVIELWSGPRRGRSR